jgi:hypothetical protein
MTHDPATCQCRYQAHRCAQCEAAFVDPDDPAPPDTRPTMPVTALRQPRATGWQAMR